MDTPWLRAKKTRHEAQERRIGNLPGGSKQVGSGRIWRWKRDGKLFVFLIEARTTQDKGYRITAEEFKEITKEALQTPPGMLPAMQIDIQDVSGIFIRLVDFNEIYTRMLDLEAQVAAKNDADGSLP